MTYDPENTEPPEDDVTGDVPRLVCPGCGSTALLYIGEAWDRNFFISGHWRCLVCNHKFLDNDIEVLP